MELKYCSHRLGDCFVGRVRADDNQSQPDHIIDDTKYFSITCAIGNTRAFSNRRARCRGGATDVCSAYAEYKTAVNAETPQAQGPGFEAAAVDLRKFAPAVIKDVARLIADVMNEVG